MNRKIRAVWAEKTFELTNIAAGAIIFGQLFSEKGLQVQPLIVGVLFIAIGYASSYILLNGKIWK